MQQVEWGAVEMDDYKEHLRRLARHDGTFVLAGDESTPSSSALDPKTVALARVAATIAVDSVPLTFEDAVAHALASGATCDEIVATLEAVTPVTGAARVVSAAPRVALALGYDVEAALEEFDP